MISRNAQRANHAAPTKTNAPAAHVTPSVNAEPKRLRSMFGPPPRLDEDESSALPLPTSVGAGVGVGGCSMTTVDWMVPCVSGSKVGGGGTLVGVGAGVSVGGVPTISPLAKSSAAMLPSERNT